MGQQWNISEHQADLMKNQKAYTSYRYEDNKGNGFVYWSNSNYDLRIYSGEGIFDYSERRFVDVMFGIYDINDNLLEKSSITLKVEKNAAFATVPYKKKTAVKVIKYLNENEGYVRILAPLYGNTLGYELIVPCRKNEQ